MVYQLKIKQFLYYLYFFSLLYYYCSFEKKIKQINLLSDKVGSKLIYSNIKVVLVDISKSNIKFKNKKKKK